MRIIEARYIDEDDNVEVIHLNEMTTNAYEKTYQGNLYCPTHGCAARIVYSGGMRPYYRTWNHDNHSTGCLHAFDRLPIRRSNFTEDAISVDISYERRQNALRDASKLMDMSEEELESLRTRRAKYRNRPRQTTQEETSTSVAINSTLIGGETTESSEVGYRGRNISKRYVDSISESDIGEIRLVMGELINADLVDNVADLFIARNDVQIRVVFEEAFTAEPSNSRYLNNFNLISSYIENYEEIQFVGIGEIRRNRRTQEIELVVYHGTDFKIDGDDMLYLGRHLNQEE
ncbi:hypothetical protein ACNA06_17855 [Lysinibacillus sp. RSDA_15]|uniref:hypothetical protein n=1 Tax=Lysinibacillus sp. RSDA_15 TaxID=3391421 RepID=UPI003A4D7226